MRTPLSTLALLLSATLSSAQFAPPQPPPQNQPPQGRLMNVPTTSAQSPYVVPSSGSRPVFGSGGAGFGYGGVFIENPYSGFLNGTANLVSAYGQYAQDFQQSRLIGQDVERSKINTRRAFMEQQMWEQSLQPTAEDIRRQELERTLRRSTNDPPLSEIISGLALNSLLANIQGLQAKGAYGPMVPVDESWLPRINLSSTPGQNIAMFRDGGKLRFPFALRDTPFDSEREQIQDLVYKAVKETSNDELTPATLRALQGATNTLSNKIDQAGRESMALNDLIQSQRFISDLRAATNALQSSTASSALNRKFAAQGRSVGDLVSFMTKNGLRFAPASQGDEGVYRALHQAMLSYNFGTMSASQR